MEARININKEGGRIQLADKFVICIDGLVTLASGERWYPVGPQLSQLDIEDAVCETGPDGVRRVKIFATRELAQEEIDWDNEERLEAGMDLNDEGVMTLADWLARGGVLD